jgi:transcriptional regulator with XRE-family HTH domain
MKNDQRIVLGKLLREKRVSLGISQVELAEKLNITQGQIGKIERGEVGISIERLSELSLVLKTSMVELIVEADYDTIPDKVKEKYQFSTNYVKWHRTKYFEREVIQLREENLLIKKDIDALLQQVNSLRQRISSKENLIDRIRAHVVLGEALPQYRDVLQSYAKKVFLDNKEYKDFLKATGDNEAIKELDARIINKIFNVFIQDMLKNDFIELETDSGLEQTIYLHFKEIDDAFSEMMMDLTDDENIKSESQKEKEQSENDNE